METEAIVAAALAAVVVVVVATWWHHHKLRQIEADEIDRYWDERFAGQEPELGRLDPQLARVIDLLYLSRQLEDESLAHPA